MTFARLNWEIETFSQNDLVEQLALETQYSKPLLELCIKRGYQTKEAILEFLSTKPTLFHDPFLLYDMEKAIERMTIAIEQEEKILIFGDYDADGITSTVILMEALESLGANLCYYLPDRFKDGYGPNVEVFNQYIQQGVTLIITVDCGVAAHDAIEDAMAQGIDVIITDHHEIPFDMPKAFAIIHPRHPLGQYPFKDLSGAGVAYKVACALLGEPPYELLEIASIGTVADLVDLSDENRTIVKLGLQSMKYSERIGMKCLLEKLNISPNEITEEVIGFQIAPRLNALGRLGSANPGVELFLTYSVQEANQIIDHMEKENNRRKEIVDQITKEAIEKVQNLPEMSVAILWDESWHEGVLGIVASRVVEKIKKPVIILNHQKNTDLLKGSARSIDVVNLYEALTHCKEYLLKFGGHHMAAGLTMELAQVEAFRQAMEQFCQQKVGNCQDPIQFVDAQLSMEDVTIELAEMIEAMRPFGTGNKEPVFLLSDVTLKSIKQIGTNKNHLKLEFGNENQKLTSISFQNGSWAEALTAGMSISTIGNLSINQWQQLRTVQWKLKDIELPEKVCYDWRASSLKPQHMEIKDCLYVVNDEDLVQKLANKLDTTSRILTWDAIQSHLHSIDQQFSSVAILDCPKNQEVLKESWKSFSKASVYIIAISREQVMLLGLPTRQQLKTMYQYLSTHPNLPIDSRLSQIANYLQLPYSQFKFILRLFMEAGWIEKNQQYIQFQNHGVKQNIQELPLMKQREEQLFLEKKFIYSSFSELKQWLTTFE